MKNSITILLITLGLVACSSEPKPDPDPIDPGPLMAAAAAVDVTMIVETFEDKDGDEHWDEDEVFDDLNGDGEFNPVWIAGFGMNRPAIIEEPFAYERTNPQYGEGFCVNPEFSQELMRALHDALDSLNTRP